MKLRPCLLRLLPPAFLLAAVFASPAAALAAVGAEPAVTGWTQVPSPSPSDQGSYLTALATITPTDVWAVGAAYRPTSTPGTLTEHWDGTAWKVVPSPNFNQGYNELYGAAAISSTDVWAVGYHNVAEYGSEKTMALHWNGTAWSIVPTRNIGPDANMLKAVDGVASNDVWAVGLGHSSSAEVGRPLIQHWDGSRWSLSPSPNVGRGSSILTGVTAVAADDVWAVGSHDDATLIEHWDGTAWTVVSSPGGARPESALYAVSAAGPDDVWATGESYDNNASDTLVEHWDGSSWTVALSVDGNKSHNSLSGVQGFAGGGVWAVGTTYDPVAVSYKTLTEHWDGAAWTIVPSPNPGPIYDYLIGVAGFQGGDVWAVGAAHVGTLTIRTTDG